jgi:UDP-N-acetylmuramoylalanine--D-glutamate ligase
MEHDRAVVRDWQGLRVAIIGAARQGLALARYLITHGAQVVITDQRAVQEMQPARDALADLADQDPESVTWVLGGHPLSVLDGIDMLCPSGGVPLDIPLIVAAQMQGIALSNDSQIFLDNTTCKVIGITGSAGKTTTTSLVGRMMAAGLELGFDKYRKVWVGGNIGSPLIAVVDEIQPSDLAFMEVSSFQLELMDSSPQVATVLNVTPNHLDRHGTMEAYTAAKARILDFQDRDGVAVLSRDDPGAWGLRDHVHGSLLSFGLSRLPQGQQGVFLDGDTVRIHLSGETKDLIQRELVELRGEHNLLNVMAACALAGTVGLPPEAMRAGVDGFRGVPHRLEFVRKWHGSTWYNDSIATAPERAIAAINSFNEPLVLLVGGRDKNLPWENFADLAHHRVDHLVVFGEAAEKIIGAMTADPAAGISSRITISRCIHLSQAVEEAARLAQAGDVVLLSPGCTSFDEFTDFEERGKCFVQWVNELM